ncbi:MAG: hypothetical protein ACM30G_18790 [Micromonosporaceae bacterium]
MRHLRSILLTLVLTPVIYISVGYGLVRAAGVGHLDLGAGLAAVTALVLAGALYAVLVLVRLSPAGLVLGGLALLGAGLWAFFGTGSFLGTMPSSVLGQGGVMLAAAPVAAVLGVPLLATVGSPRRWRESAIEYALPAYAIPEADTLVQSGF